MRPRNLLTVAVIALAATACIKAEYDIVVEDDGSGLLEAVIAVDADAFAGLGEMFGEEMGGDELGREQLCEEFRSDTDFPPEVDVREYDEDGFCGYRIRTRWEATDDPGAALDRILSAEDGGEDDATVLRREPDGGWLLVAPLDSGDLAASSDEVPPFMAQQFLADASVRFAITLPGRPVEHNATSVDGNTFVWQIDLADPVTELRARTEPGSPGGGGDGFPWGIVVAVIAGLLVIGAVLALVRRGSKVTADPMHPGATAAAGSAAGGSVDGVPATGGTGATAPPVADQPQPVWDGTANAWVVDDPVRGRLRHDPASGQWVPAEQPPAPPPPGPPAGG
jgi:hypothetical protein